MKALDELIAATPVFTGLEQRYLRIIADCAVNEHFAPEELLFREGAPADRFYLIRSGTIALELDAPGGAALVLETLHDGDVVGFSWLFEPYRCASDARARTPTRVVGFDGACLRGKCDEDHELGYQLMSRFAATLTERLHATRLQLLDIYGHAHVR